MVSDRGLEVLRAIVQDYVSSREPVGSKAIADRHAFGVSAATIRNEMALLEEEELIAAPHTSSGRVPTDKGYRLFVDTLREERALTATQRSAIERFLGESHDIDDMLARTVRLLAQLTNQVAVVQYPSLERTVVRQLELVSLGERKVLSVMIAANGLVDQSLVKLSDPVVSADWLNGVRDRIRGLVVGLDLAAARRALQEKLAEHAAGQENPEQALVTELLTAVHAQLESNQDDRVAIAGASNLVKTEGDFTQSVLPLLEAIDEQVVLLKLFRELSLDAQVQARIGRENDPLGLPETAILTSAYESSTDSVSGVAVVGAMRMDYAANIAAVRAVVRYLNRAFTDGDQIG